MSDLTVLHYLGYQNDRGGIVSVVRTLAEERRFECILGVNPDFVQHRTPPLPVLGFSQIEGETIGIRSFWKARRIAGEVSEWLAKSRHRVFHGHSRAGLLVATWLARRGETRCIASVHCYGKQRWYYRHAARQLEQRLFWLTPAMRAYYGIRGAEWEQCIPACVKMLDTPLRERPARAVLRLGGIGALVEWKGWHLVLAALAELPKPLRSRFCFRHIGGPDDSVASNVYAARLREETRDAALDAFVEWRGVQPSAGPLLDETDVLVVASFNEPCSVAMLEALQRGIPVIAADSGGARDIIQSRLNGWLFRTGDPVSLADVFRRLLEKEEDQVPRANPGSLARFLAPRVAAQWLSVYQQSVHLAR